MDRNTAVTTWREVCGSDLIMAMLAPTGRLLEAFAAKIEAAALSARQPLTSDQRDLLRYAAAFCKGEIGRCDPVRADAAANLVLQIAGTPGFTDAAVTDEMVDRACAAFNGKGHLPSAWKYCGPQPEFAKCMRKALEAALAQPAEPSIPASKVREIAIEALHCGYDKATGPRVMDAGFEADRILASYTGAGNAD